MRLLPSLLLLGLAAPPLLVSATDGACGSSSCLLGLTCVETIGICVLGICLKTHICIDICANNPCMSSGNNCQCNPLPSLFCLSGGSCNTCSNPCASNPCSNPLLPICIPTPNPCGSCQQHQCQAPPAPAPTKQPTKLPTPSPTKYPTPAPTKLPTPFPTKFPTPSPTKQPTPSPTKQPTPAPTKQPTPAPTKQPTPSPTKFPTPSPTKFPTPSPTKQPTPAPTKFPTPSPTKFPTPSPTKQPTPAPTKFPTPSPTRYPTPFPTKLPTPSPTKAPTRQPTPAPTPYPTKAPTKAPTKYPTVPPTKAPTCGSCGSCLVFVPQVTIFSCLIGQITPLQLVPQFTQTCGVPLVFSWTITASGYVSTAVGLALTVVPEELPGFGVFTYVCTCVTTGATITFQITKGRRPLHCEIAGPSSVSLGAAITLDAALSYDLEGSPLSCSWSCGSCPGGGLLGGLVSFVGLLIGSYTFRLDISTPDGRSASCQHPCAVTLLRRELEAMGVEPLALVRGGSTLEGERASYEVVPALTGATYKWFPTPSAHAALVGSQAAYEVPAADTMTVMVNVTHQGGLVETLHNTLTVVRAPFGDQEMAPAAEALGKSTYHKVRVAGWEGEGLTFQYMWIVEGVTYKAFPNANNEQTLLLPSGQVELACRVRNAAGLYRDTASSVLLVTLPPSINLHALLQEADNLTTSDTTSALMHLALVASVGDGPINEQQTVKMLSVVSHCLTSETGGALDVPLVLSVLQSIIGLTPTPETIYAALPVVHQLFQLLPNPHAPHMPLHMALSSLAIGDFQAWLSVYTRIMSPHRHLALSTTLVCSVSELMDYWTRVWAIRGDLSEGEKQEFLGDGLRALIMDQHESQHQQQHQHDISLFGSPAHASVHCQGQEENQVTSIVSFRLAHNDSGEQADVAVLGRGMKNAWVSMNMPCFGGHCKYECLHWDVKKGDWELTQEDEPLVVPSSSLVSCPLRSGDLVSLRRLPLPRSAHNDTRLAFFITAALILTSAVVLLALLVAAVLQTKLPNTKYLEAPSKEVELTSTDQMTV